MIHELPESIIQILTQPGKFFDGIKNDGLPTAYQHYIALLIPYSILSGIVSIIGNSNTLTSFIINLPTSGYKLQKILSPLITELGFLIMFITFLAGMYLVFFSGAVIHGCVLLAGGEKGIGQTLKVQMYSFTPFLILGWIPIIGLITLLWSAVIMVVGLQRCSNLNLWKSVLVIILPILLLGGCIGTGVIILESLLKILTPFNWI